MRINLLCLLYIIDPEVVYIKMARIMSFNDLDLGWRDDGIVPVELMWPWAPFLSSGLNTHLIVDTKARDNPRKVGHRRNHIILDKSGLALKVGVTTQSWHCSLCAYSPLTVSSVVSFIPVSSDSDLRLAVGLIGFKFGMGLIQWLSPIARGLGDELR